MTEILRTPNTFMPPSLEGIEDEEIKKVFEEYNKILTEFFININSDLTWMHKRLKDLGG